MRAFPVRPSLRRFSPGTRRFPLLGCAVALTFTGLGATACTVTEATPGIERSVDATSAPGTGDGDASAPTGPLGYNVDSFVGQVWTVYNTDQGLNLRSGPGTSNESLTRLAPGTEVTTTGSITEINDETWFEVTSGFGNGWVHSSFLTIDTEAPPASSIAPLAFSDDPSLAAAAPLFTPGTRVTPNEGLDGVNIRSTPNGTIVLGLRAGDVGTTTGDREGDWLEVEFRGVSGWSLADLLLETAQPVTGSHSVVAINVPGGSAAIHREPRSDSAVIATATHNAELVATGVETASGWTELLLDPDTTGWIPTDLLVVPE